MSPVRSGDTSQANVPRLVLYGRSDCHLCEVAKEVIAQVRRSVAFEVEERNVEDDPQWESAYGEQIPVGFVGERKVFKFRVDPEALKRALSRAP